MPDYRIETSHAPRRVCGVDEAGRGPWAGPVVAAAVLFTSESAIPSGLDDSKKLTAKSRAALATALYADPTRILIGVGTASVEEIDRLNIWGATSLAMTRAITALPDMPDLALIDGKLIPKNFPCAAQAIVGGDATSISIAAASIIAKTTRDCMMEAYAREHPHYGFDRHAGYGTAAHQAALAEHGPCVLHRRSFRPIRELLEKQPA